MIIISCSRSISRGIRSYTPFGNYVGFYPLANDTIKSPHKIAARRAMIVRPNPPTINQTILFVAVASLPVRI